MKILTQDKNRIVGIKASFEIFIEKQEGSTEFDIVLTDSRPDYWVILGSYKDEQTAQNIISDVFEDISEDENYCIMPKETDYLSRLKLIQSLDSRG